MTIFDTVPLDQLRRRTSEKWRHYPPDVLPLFVAEMDVPQPEPVVRTVVDAMRRTTLRGQKVSVRHDRDSKR